MKKLISILLCFAILSGVFGAFPVSASDDTSYSGGSGTEDDPYLISTEDDIRELKNNIKNDPSLWYTKYYYRLTNDIETYTQISPLYSAAPADYINKHSLVKVSGYIDDRCVMYSVTEYEYIRYEGIEATVINPTIDPGSKDSKYYNMYYRYGDEFFESWPKRIGIYRSAAFTGVFDGNGFTITYKGSNSLFGFVENGAVIKNLNVKSDKGNFAYCIDSSTIKSCSLFSDRATCAVDYNLGTITDIVNYSENAAELCDYKNGPMQLLRPGYWELGKETKTVNYSKNTTNEKEDSNYTYNECINANGEASYFEHLDFENVWVMMDGMPTLRTACEKGDTNFDGSISAKDANKLKSFISIGVPELSESKLIISDINGDGAVNAKDSNLLKQMLTGTN